MKANWKIALMCFATLAFVACDEKNPAEDPGGDLFDYNPPIEVNDHTIADWDNLDQSKVYEAYLPASPLYSALQKIRVYADSVCIFYQLTFDPDQMVSHTPVDAMHIYMDADNSDATGGYFDQFDEIGKGNTDLMFEGPLWDDYGNQISYVPEVSYWSGQLNGEGWEWTAVPSSNKIGSSQFVGDNVIEGRLVIELIPFTFADDFTIGFDIQQNYESVGLLPQGNTPDGQLIGRSKKLYVKFDK